MQASYRLDQGASFDMMIVPLAANMPPLRRGVPRHLKQTIADASVIALIA
jgi:hypothetical protein